MDNALIRKAIYDKEELNRYLNHVTTNTSEDFLSPLISFVVNNTNITFGNRYQVEYEGAIGIFYPRSQYYSGRLANWPSDSDMPMIISGYLSGSNTPSYHLRYINNKRADLIHFQMDEKTAKSFIMKYEKQFYHK